MGSLQLTIMITLLLTTLILSVDSQTAETIDISKKKRNLGESPETLRRIKKQISDDKYTDAAYAGKFAFMLKDLESQNKDVYTNFISSGFTGETIPRELPPQIRSLSRISSQPQLSASTNFISSNSIHSSFPTGERIQQLSTADEVQLLNGRGPQVIQLQNTQLPNFQSQGSPIQIFSQGPQRQGSQRQGSQRQGPQRQGPQRLVSQRLVPQRQGLQRQPLRRPVPFRGLRL